MVKWMTLMILLLPQQHPVNVNKKGVAVDGYDVVSYFSGEVKKGMSEFTQNYSGATYYFSSEENKAAFSSQPDKYLPQYGGYCAYAMAETGDKVSVDPKTYTITDGKLYLFYNSFGNNTLTPWMKSEPQFVKKANENWQSKYVND